MYDWPSPNENPAPPVIVKDGPYSWVNVDVYPNAKYKPSPWSNRDCGGWFVKGENADYSRVAARVKVRSKFADFLFPVPQIPNAIQWFRELISRNNLPAVGAEFRSHNIFVLLGDTEDISKWLALHQTEEDGHCFHVEHISRGFCD